MWPFLSILELVILQGIPSYRQRGLGFSLKFYLFFFLSFEPMPSLLDVQIVYVGEQCH